ncbi:hypothetical protein DJ568_03045 [Mucilaginibacter hurinus]|uniref:Porin n=1 Tax=Mucilaginibacter hurinus TaxID=2201324 RepID=A0A367GTV1_9SPHI|nr:hypothetical protein [Mucilaginibacter hurinus]RCH56847.1 hypothetical protein DJ568_03045 [Mucilaginibacter hurinus]
MKKVFIMILMFTGIRTALAQIDSTLLRRSFRDSSGLKLNMDATYDRPFLSLGKLPVSLGGYAEANYQHLGTDGVSEGHQFQMRRFTLFVASTVYDRIKFLSEVEFEDGAKEINIEFAALDLELHPLVNLRGGIVLNPIGSFNQNHDGPKWEFIDRPVSATEMLPATWSNAGFGLYGKAYRRDWIFAYEAYLTNGFNDFIINNPSGRTSLAAAKLNPDRFEESYNGMPLFTLKTAVKKQRLAEIGVSYMGGIYNKFQDDGLTLDKKRRVDVFALDMNTILAKWGTALNAEWAWVQIDVAPTYTQQYGRRQQGGFLDIVQPVFRGTIAGLPRSVINLALRAEYVDWNVGRFRETGDPIGDHLWALTPGISWRPGPQTVFRLNYKIVRQTDLLGNSPSRTGGFQLGISSYF